ncbi:alpha-xylosidase [Bacteroidia bacterium]|nr:alpha-xylosidase [Bacteroidia bacterium]
MVLSTAIIAAFIFSFSSLAENGTPLNAAITTVNKINPTTVEVVFSDNNRRTIDFYGDNIFRLFQDNSGRIMRDPEAKPEAKIVVTNPRKPVSTLDIKPENSTISILTNKIEILLDKNTSMLKVINRETNKVVFEEMQPVSFEKDKVTLTLKENPNEYFYGGGVQNGRFSHKGKAISIENQNSWTDGGVASPNPYYWSTNGYGIMWYTFKKGKYDFGAEEKGIVKLYHETDYLDAFFMINDGAVALLNDFYQLTGNPVLLPKFAFYQGHLNAYNRDFWTRDEGGILFEDGKRYKESQKDNGGIKESLNGEKDNYPFSARAVIDRYKHYDIPLGWILPNDGYGAGYGQTETLDGNIQNLKSLGDYARKNGVEIGLWTQSDLHPKEGVDALLQRDIVKEVRDAGVRVLKTDVAWVGAGYSFGLNGITDVAQIMTYYGNDARPFIISLDGWAGTQRYAGIWSGDQTGGVWEYIRFHIPTYIGSGLSGNPNITSDMDGIFGGKNVAVNIRDFQWKTFTPMQLNMDGWGTNEKYPHALGEPATSINRHYLKLKAELIPYTYSIAKESLNGLPMIRALFLEYPNDYTLGKATRYQFLYGPYFLVAPIYKETKADKQGNDLRNNIYLPENAVWIDYFTGEAYEGGRIINSFDAPLWKLPVFVKNGAIIPMTNPNNNVSEINKNLRIYEIYPYGYSAFTEYDDDGISEKYRQGYYSTTRIESNVDKKNSVSITIHPAQGDFDGFIKEKATEFRINATQKPKAITAQIGKNKVKLTEANSLEIFENQENTYFYDAAPHLNKFATKGSGLEQTVITKNPQVRVKLAPTDIKTNKTVLTVEGFKFEPADRHKTKTGTLTAPLYAQITEENTGAYSLNPTWKAIDNADFYEIDFDKMLYTTIKDTTFLLEGLDAETKYSFNLRAVNKDGFSDWVQITATTQSNPLEFAIKGIEAETTAENQGRSLRRLFDFEEGELWHTKYGENAIPLDLVMDLKTINQLDKFHYVPRDNAGNGTILKGSVLHSYDKENWTPAGAFEWARNSDVKGFEFTGKPEARYVKLTVTEAVGGYGSGRELYVFKTPGTKSYLPGDINNDGKIDGNDLTSYRNYAGLRSGDADFEGYISNGDINKNGLIDAYDISVVATLLDGGINNRRTEKMQGAIRLSTAKQNYNAGETVEIKVSGIDLLSVNALSFALPYNPQDYEYAGIETLNTKEMENLTNDRLHTNGNKALYPTFVNLGEKASLEGTQDLFIIKLKAKRKVKFDLKAIDGFLVDKKLNIQKFPAVNTYQ